MKKILATAFIIGNLYCTANATTINSPIYLPASKEIVSSLDVGYTKSNFDKANDTTLNTTKEDEFEKSWNLNVDAKYGLNNSISLNYGLNFDFDREIFETEESSKLTNIYVGITGRVIDKNLNKVDILFNFGGEVEKYWTYYHKNVVYSDLALRYGLDFDSYNVALSVGSKYTDSWKDHNKKIDSEFNFFTKLENEFIFSESVTMGLDFFYIYNPKNTYNNNGIEQSYKAFSEYGLNVDLNYAFDSNNYLGVYFCVIENNINQNYISGSSTLNYKDLTEYGAGIRLNTRF